MLVGAHPGMPLQAWYDCVQGLIKKHLPRTNFPVVVNTYTSHLSPCWLVPFSEECRLDKDGSLVFRWDRARLAREC
jgi:hypothetical protein